MFGAKDNKGRTIFHEAAGSSGREVIEEILNCATENITREEVHKLFVATDNEGRTVFHEAGKSYKEGNFQEILNCAKENLTREEVNKLSVATDNEGRTVWQFVKRHGNRNSLYKM